MEQIIKKIQYHQKEINKLEKKLNKLKEDIEWQNYDENQIKVIKDKSDVLLVEAYPGSGKTHTLLGKVKKLVDENPKILTKIIVITFTKKAGEELKEKLKKIVSGGEPYFVGTFHGLAYRELSKVSESGLSLLDQVDERKMIKELARDLIKRNHINSNMGPIIDKYGDLSYQVSSTRYPPSIEEFCNKNGLSEYLAEFKTLLEAYENEKRSMKLVDFNDLMIKFYLQFKNNKMAHLEKIDYVFFDEYQDVNPIQNQILKEFVSRGIKLMVVGDPRQSIYNFRGSEVGFINNFEKYFPKAKRHILSYNYRSCNDIIKLSNSIFSPGLEMKTKNPEHQKPKVKIFTDFRVEKKFVIDDIVEKNKLGRPFREMTILSRKNKILAHIEADLIRRQIPYLKNGGTSLLERKHIKDLLSFLTILFFPEQKFHWKNVLMLHPNIGAKTANKIMVEPLPKGFDKYLSDKRYEMLPPLVNFLKKLDNLKLKDKAYEITNYINELGVTYNYNLEDRDNDYLALAQFMDSESGFTHFIEEIYLQRTISQPNQDDYLEINSFHGSKGLEWNTVYLVGLTGSEIPHYHPNFFLEEHNAIEEERRLFFVACTRAKKELFMTANLSSPWKRDDSITPFLLELDSNAYHGKLISNNHKKPSELVNLIKSYLYQKGNSELQDFLCDIKFKRLNITDKWEIPTNLQSHYLPLVVGKFWDSLVTRMLWDEFEGDKSWPNQPNQDFNSSWEDNVELLWSMAGGSEDNNWHEYLTNIHQEDLSDFSTKLLDYFKEMKVSKIELYPKVNYKGVFGELDILTDKFIVEIKTSFGEILTMQHLLQAVFYWFIVKQDKTKKVNKILFYNPLTGEGYLLTKTKAWIELAKRIFAHYCGAEV